MHNTPRILSEGDQSFDDLDYNRLQIDKALQNRTMLWMSNKVDFTPVQSGEISPAIFIEQCAAKAPEELGSAIRVILAVVLAGFVTQAGCASYQTQMDDNTIPDEEQVRLATNEQPENIIPEKTIDNSEVDALMKQIKIDTPYCSMSVIPIVPDGSKNNVSSLNAQPYYYNMAKAKATAIEALGETGPDAKEAFPAILKELNTTLWRNIVKESTAALCKIDPEEAIPQITETMDSFSKTRVQIGPGSIVPKEILIENVIYGLSNCGSAAVPLIISGIKYGTWDIKRAIAFSLGEIGPDIKSTLDQKGIHESDNAITTLAHLLSDEDSWTRERVVVALGKIGSITPEVNQLLIRGLEDESFSVRRDAAKSLGKVKCKTKEEAKALKLALKDPEYDVRMNAADALGAMGSKAKSAIKALRNTALKDEGTRVMESAVAALGKIGSNAIPALKYILKSNNLSASHNAAYALGDIGPDAKSAIPALISMLKHKDSFIRTPSIYALGKIGPEAKSAIPKIINAVRMSDVTNDANSAIEALSNMGSDAIPALEKALTDKSFNVREMASKTLERITQVKDKN